jgi:hypothetical protein
VDLEWSIQLELMTHLSFNHDTESRIIVWEDTSNADIKAELLPV